MQTFKTNNRNTWRKWLKENYKKEKEILFIFPNASINEESISYNDAVEEALCFGWIDGKANKVDDNHSARRFTPRKNNSYSRFNIERLIWLNENNKLQKEIKEEVLEIINKPFIYPKDIIDKIKQDKEAYKNYLNFKESYKRIRIASIEEVRNNGEEFNKRLNNFINKTKENKLILGFGWDSKYYE